MKIAALLLLLLAPAIASAEPDPCSPGAIKLASTSKLLVEWKKPDACEIQNTTNKTVLASQQDLDAHLKCPKDTKLAIDWKKQALVAYAWMMSPAAAGLDVYDDGHVITIVNRDRSPCPNDPHAMPITLPKFFVTTQGTGERQFAVTSCTIKPKCK